MKSHDAHHLFYSTFSLERSEIIDIQDNIRSQLDKEYCPTYSSDVIQEIQENVLYDEGNN